MMLSVSIYLIFVYRQHFAFKVMYIAHAKNHVFPECFLEEENLIKIFQVFKLHAISRFYVSSIKALYSTTFIACQYHVGLIFYANDLTFLTHLTPPKSITCNRQCHRVFDGIKQVSLVDDF